MKFYLTGSCHHKNIESIRKTLQLHGIPWEEHNDLSALNDSFTVVMCFSQFYPPSAFPPTCKVLYGPHFFVVPEDSNHPLYHHTYDDRFFFNTLCPWVSVLYREFCGDRIRMPFIPAFFGIDTESIRIVPPPEERKEVLVYVKQRNPAHVQRVFSFLERRCIPYKAIHYGSYRDHDFKHALQSTSFVVWVGRHESQGFALQETLASNVPILLWDAETMYEEYDGHRAIYEGWRQKGIQCVSTVAPAWSPECGIRFTKADELDESFDRMTREYTSMAPRSFVEKTLSLRPAFQNLCHLMGIKESTQESM
jgi:hypothetical protein